ncbi:30S ribosome-binding factor RbfA [Tepidibacter formicigenes]|jgi:ribosome-binding factor A|uniref:Ribosome-binding factor A n=1 Tax=Tepidibacter formicigenes DSM 15518 TaxID=1123349 RepID=A0A1M6JCP1_9FIRM|nr:30S ribosome-binding factor RbfA [Tepidibacter formicigenes]SHJ44461.1 ribosome-binding factor A [Tepidibacter formicigenes DSM 15518]
MSTYPRTKRIGEEIKKVVSRLLLEGIKDPRVSTLVSVTDVDVTSDLKYAYIYVSVLSGDKESTLKGLKSASGFIRREVGKNIKLRYTPEIIFKLDESIEKGLYMSNLIKNLNIKKEDDENE